MIRMDHYLSQLKYDSVADFNRESVMFYRLKRFLMSLQLGVSDTLNEVLLSVAIYSNTDKA